MRKSLLSVLSTASALLLVGAGCDKSYLKKLMPPEPPMEQTISSPDAQARMGAPMVVFGKELSMSANTKVSYRDGLIMEIISVTDTRCPEGTKCDSRGSAVVKVRLSGGDVGAVPKDVELSLPKQTFVRQDGYMVFLGDVSGSTAAITLSKEMAEQPAANTPPKAMPTLPPQPKPGPAPTR